MAEDPTALVIVQEAGLPEGFKTKAAKFLLRFIAGTLGHRALQVAQDGFDTLAGRTKIAMAQADALAKELVADPEEMARARARFLGETYRKQQNVEAIAQIAAEEIATDPVEPLNDPEDDWLNVFTRYAEDSSSERARRLWGRVLAGEFRAPGSISLRTLRLLSELDQQTADDFEKIVGNITGDFIYRAEGENQGEPFLRLARLETAGLIALGGGFFTRKMMPKGDLTLLVRGDPLSLAGKLPGAGPVTVPCCNVTASGMELARLIRKRVTTRDALLRLASFVKANGAERLVIGEVLTEGQLHNIEVIHG